MKLSKRMMLPMAAVAMLGAVAMGAGVVSAASNGQPGALAQKIASAFNLDPAKVQAVIDQNQTAAEQKRETTYEDRLQQAVTSGRLTAAQQQAILAENAKLKAELAGAGSLSPADRRTLTQKVRQEAQTWAQQNGIAVKWLMAGGKHPRGGTETAPSPTPSPSASPNA
jgi:hypothetical protein